jgi:hypothetical protein
MWDEVKSPGLRRITSALTRRHAMKGMESRARHLKGGKTQTIPRLEFQTQRKFH